MALAPVYLMSDFMEDYPNFFLKFYEQGTTTPIVMAINSTGSPTVAKAEISAGPTPPIGLIKTAGNVTFIPYVTEAYDAYLFPTEAEADANDTANAIQIADDVDFLQNFASSVGIARSFDTVALMVAATDLNVGDIVETAGYTTKGDGGDNRYEVVSAASGTVDGGTFIDLDTHQAKGLFPGSRFNVKQFGAFGDGVIGGGGDVTGTDDTTAIQNTIATGKHITFPTGVFIFSSTLKLIEGGQTWEGAGRGVGATVQAGTQLVWNGSTGNALELNSRRRDTPSSVFVLTGARITNFLVSSATSSTCENMLWVEAATFHSSIDHITFDLINGTVTESVVKYDSGVTFGSHPLRVNMSHCQVRGNVAFGVIPIPRGIYLQSAIECEFEDVVVFECEESWVIGDFVDDQTFIIQNLNFISCMAEMGDRQLQSGDGRALVINYALNCNWFGGKFVCGAQTVPASIPDQRSLSFNNTGTATTDVIDGCNFNGTQFWAFGQADYQIEVEAGATVKNSTIHNCYFINAVLGDFVISSGGFAEIDWGRNNAYVQTEYNLKRNSSAILRDEVVGTVLALENTVVTITDRQYGRNEVILNSIPVDLAGTIATNYKADNNQIHRTTITNQNVGGVNFSTVDLFWRRLYDDEISSVGKKTIDFGTISKGTLLATTLEMPGVVLGDIVSATAYVNTTAGLDGVTHYAYVSATDEIEFLFFNGTTFANINLDPSDWVFNMHSGKYDYFATKTFDPPSVATANKTSTTITVTGAVLGDFVVASFSLGLQQIIMNAYVSAADTVTVDYWNFTGSPINLASGTIRVGVYRNSPF